MEEGDQKETIQNCNTTFGKRKLQAIYRVECRENGVLLQTTTKEAVEHAIMKENSNRFRLACSSPTLYGNLHNDLSPLGEGPLVHYILTSQESLRSRPEVQGVFDLFHNSQHKSISSHIATEQWIEQWSHAKERTASSFSGIYFGHYKAHTVKREIAES